MNAMYKKKIYFMYTVHTFYLRGKTYKTAHNYNLFNKSRQICRHLFWVPSWVLNVASAVHKHGGWVKRLETFVVALVEMQTFVSVNVYSLHVKVLYLRKWLRGLGFQKKNCGGCSRKVSRVSLEKL